MQLKNNNKLLFSFSFILLGFLALQVPLWYVAGSKVTFTMFDAFGPIAAGFLGSAPGAICVLLMEVINVIFHGAHFQKYATIIHLVPMVFAAIYFGKKTKLNYIIPALCIILFLFNPIGRSVWYYSLYWVIPVICYFFQEKFLFARSLGATFTAHAVGGTLWVYFFPLPKAVWIALIPLVAIERLIFVFGIMVTYVVCNNFLYYINHKKVLTFTLPVHSQYVWRWA